MCAETVDVDVYVYVDVDGYVYVYVYDYVYVYVYGYVYVDPQSVCLYINAAQDKTRQHENE